MLFPPSSITFSQTPSATWQFTSDFQENLLFSAWISSDGRGSISEGTFPKDTGVPTDQKIEVLVADTPSGSFHNTCSTPTFTGNAASDLNCIAQAAIDQGFNYAISDSWHSIATTSLSATQKPHCKCP